MAESTANRWPAQVTGQYCPPSSGDLIIRRGDDSVEPKFTKKEQAILARADYERTPVGRLDLIIKDCKELPTDTEDCDLAYHALGLVAELAEVLKEHISNG